MRTLVQRREVRSSKVCTSTPSIERSTSPDLMPASKAGASATGSRTSPGSARRTPAFLASWTVLNMGISCVPEPTFERSECGASSRTCTVSGCVQIKKRVENNNPARRKFMKTPARRIITCFHQAACGRASLCLLSGSSKFSPFNRTNPPIGSQLIVQSVHFLSRKNRKIFGGIPSPNSSTFTPLHRAVRKCPNSWIKTTKKKTTSANIIPITRLIKTIKK